VGTSRWLIAFAAPFLAACGSRTGIDDIAGGSGGEDAGGDQGAAPAIACTIGASTVGPPENRGCSFGISETCSDGHAYGVDCECAPGGMCSCTKGAIGGTAASTLTSSAQVCAGAQNGCPMASNELFAVCGFPR
jgi:hypothetical protein